MAVPDIVINYWAVLVSAIVSFIIGGLWYSPLLFGNAWMKLGGFNNKDKDKAKKKGMGKLYFATFIGSLVVAYILAHFVIYMGAFVFTDGMQTGFWIWLGFIAPVLLGSVLWEGKPIKYYLINISYWLVNIVLIGGILAVWK